MPTTVARGQITVTDVMDGYSCYLTNDTVVLPSNPDGSNPILTGANTTVVVVYGGVQVTPTIGALTVSGCTATSNSNIITINSATSDSGYVDIPVSYNGVDFGKLRFSFSKSKQGVAPKVLTLEVPDGTTFQGNVGNPKTVNVILREGEVDVTANSSLIQWYFNDIEQVGLQNLKTLEVYPSDVNSNLTIKVIATYNSVPYSNSVIFVDMDDLYQVSISGMDKIKNSSENITLTAIVFRGSSQITDGFRCRWTDIGNTVSTTLTQQVNINDTVLYVNDTTGFIADGTKEALIGNDEIHYVIQSLTTNTITLASPITSNQSIGTEVTFINVIYEGINTTGTLTDRGVILTLTPSQINSKLDLLCELSVDTVEQSLSTTEAQITPSYDSRTYATAMSIALA